MLALKKYVCRRCKTFFTFNNKLYIYFRKIYKPAKLTVAKLSASTFTLNLFNNFTVRANVAEVSLIYYIDIEVVDSATPKNTL